MSKIITWDEIDSVKKFDLFTLGLQPLNRHTLEPINIPYNCHQYKILLDTHPNYSMTMDKTLTKWRNKIENFNLDTIQIKNLPEPYFDLMDSETYLFLMDSDRYMDNNVINLNLKNIEQMYASLTSKKFQ